jgi:hypothetical protein
MSSFSLRTLFSWRSSHFQIDFRSSEFRNLIRLIFISSFRCCLIKNFNRSFIWSIFLCAARFSTAISAFQTWHEFFLSYEKQSQNMNSEASFHRRRTQIFAYLSLTRRHCRILSRRKLKITLVLSLFMTFFQFSIVQFLYRKQNCRRAFIIAAFSSNFIVDLHERNSFRLNTRRIVFENTSCSYFKKVDVFSRSCLSVWTLFNITVSTIDVILNDCFDREAFIIYSSFKILNIDESYSRSRVSFSTHWSIWLTLRWLFARFWLQYSSQLELMLAKIDRDAKIDFEISISWLNDSISWLNDWWKFLRDDCVLILAYYANEIKKNASMNFSRHSPYSCWLWRALN